MFHHIFQVILMLDPKSVMNQNIPPVSAMDIRRLWTAQSQHPADSGVSYSGTAIAAICESDSADPIAVWARTSLISILLQHGELENWREKDGLPNNIVFEHAAVYPLPAGLQGFTPADFVASLSGSN